MMSYKFSFAKMILVASFLVLLSMPAHSQPASWRELPQGQACLSNTCRMGDSTCECFFTIEHRLTMMRESDRLLLRPKGGKIHDYRNENAFIDNEDVLTLDGVGSRLVISINRQYPGPEIKAYEGQTMILHVHNMMHTDTTSIHFHGIHQKNSAWSDGVAFLTQCPILPGQYFTYRFQLSQHGTYLYHSHIGDQRSMGLYGSFIVYPNTKSEDWLEHVVILQDWNHDDDPETLYQKMLYGTFNLETATAINPSLSIDNTAFSRFVFHSGIINGRGRFYNKSTHNEAPLTVYNVERYKDYRFRVISAATLFPFRVFVENHRNLTVVAADGFDITPIEVESFIIQPGERFDFILQANQNPKDYLLVAETLETQQSLAQSTSSYHAAEAIIRYTGTSVNDDNPPKAQETNCALERCKVLNCPFMYYPSSTYRDCVQLHSMSLSDPSLNISVLGGGDIEELFFNFAFPGDTDTPGSVNGRQFIHPSSPILSQYSVSSLTPCNDSLCNQDSICSCTYIEEIEKDKIYQFIISNIGVGRGWSHPIHLHGHSFYLLKIGFGNYRSDASFESETTDLRCSGTKQFCNSMSWANPTWTGNSVEGININNPILKDTVIVPSGGYVVIRFKADNPGPWFFHCHIDLHNTNGMGMVIDEARSFYTSRIPKGFPRCGNFAFDGTFKTGGPGGKASGKKGFLNYKVTYTLTVITALWSMIRHSELWRFVAAG